MRVFDKQKIQKSGWKLRNELGTNSFSFNVYSSTQSEKIALGTALDGKWHHFAITVDQSHCHVYLDGKLTRKTSLPNSMNFKNTEDLIIGAASQVAQSKRLEFDGYLDEIFIFRRVLSAEQVKRFIFP